VGCRCMGLQMTTASTRGEEHSSVGDVVILGGEEEVTLVAQWASARGEMSQR
jgi:hypothetical protein